VGAHTGMHLHVVKTVEPAQLAFVVDDEEFEHFARQIRCFGAACGRDAQAAGAGVAEDLCDIGVECEGFAGAVLLLLLAVTDVCV
jgi:hypothetical protein